jgi:hypothetical protein
MRIPKLILGIKYYICDTLYKGRYVIFNSQFKNNECEYTCLDDDLKSIYNSKLTLSVFNRSIVVSEYDFDKYPDLIKLPAINLNYSQIVSYRREILLNTLLNEDS